MKRIDFPLILCDPLIGQTMTWYRERSPIHLPFPVYSGVGETASAVRVGVFSWLRNPA